MQVALSNCIQSQVDFDVILYEGRQLLCLCVLMEFLFFEMCHNVLYSSFLNLLLAVYLFSEGFVYVHAYL